MATSFIPIPGMSVLLPDFIFKADAWRLLFSSFLLSDKRP